MKPTVKVHFFRNQNHEIYKFIVQDHTDSLVCAAVSALVLNTINSIENFTDEQFECDFEEKGGFILCLIPSIAAGAHHHDVNLLLNSLFLGVTGIALEYADKISITDEEV